MEGILYANDSQIAALKVTKRYAPEGVQPQARIGLATLEESP